MRPKNKMKDYYRVPQKVLGLKKNIKIRILIIFCRKNSSKRRSKNVNKLSRIFLMLFEIMEISKTFQYILYLNFRAKNSSKRKDVCTTA